MPFETGSMKMNWERTSAETGRILLPLFPLEKKGIKVTFMKSFALLVCLLLLFSSGSLAATLPKPDKYGQVILNNYSTTVYMSPVVFDHWLHRAMFTCRLCHVDIGFAMKAGETKISAANNKKGQYCGSCHNGIRLHANKAIFSACSDKITDEDRKRCDKCHSSGKKVAREYDYNTFTEKLPKRARSGLVDWEEAETKGIVKPIDFLEGVYTRRQPIKMDKELSIESKETWMSNIFFSHKKHAVWNGCEVCHPEIFPSTKQGTVQYTMFQIGEGQYCGVCHNKVAFPVFSCHRCHVNPVQ